MGIITLFRRGQYIDGKPNWAIRNLGLHILYTRSLNIWRVMVKGECGPLSEEIGRTRQKGNFQRGVIPRSLQKGFSGA